MEETFYVVKLSDNSNPKVRDQYCDARKSKEDCEIMAKLYSTTSHYRRIEVLEAKIINVNLVN